jgi:crotonobetainyl-CoA:carnitine CoA-transferase CaiB-like acyl-CoA transferase
MLLADMGAEVIKIEPPWGDSSRNSSRYPSKDGMNTYFMFVNRNKKSIVLNLKSEKGVDVVKKLVESSDVIVENFRPGVMKRLGIGYEALKEVNPRIIFASISGFGQTGPYVSRPSFDIIGQAMSGWMWLNSREKRGLNSKPSLIPSCLAGSPGDTIPGIFCALSILSALHARNNTGMGQRIDVAQTDSIMSLIGLAFVRYFGSGESADERANKPSTTIHGVFEAKDGYVAVRAIGRDLGKLAESIGVEEDKLSSSSEELLNWFKDRTRKEISDILSEKIPCAPVLTDEELVMDANVLEREMINETEYPQGFTYKSVASSIKLSGTPIKKYSPAPQLGQHTRKILKQLGYGDKQIMELVEEKVINAP